MQKYAIKIKLGWYSSHTTIKEKYDNLSDAIYSAVEIVKSVNVLRQCNCSNSKKISLTDVVVKSLDGYTIAYYDVDECGFIVRDCRNYKYTTVYKI